MKAGFSRRHTKHPVQQSEHKGVLEKMYASELSLVSYLPLLFSLFFFMPMLLDSFVWYEYILCFVAYGVFVFLYSLCRVQETRAYRYIILIAALALVVSPINWMSYAFLWYAAYMCGYLYSMPKALLCNAAFLLCLVVIYKFSGQPFYFFMASSSLPCIGLLFYGMFDRRIRRDEVGKRERNKQIEALATIAERERLARDMHDVVGHNLTALCLKSRLAQKLGKAGDIDGALREIAEVEHIASSALNNVRSAITEYKKRSFAEQLNALTQKLHDAGFTVDSHIRADKIEAKKESHFILILTEAVTNILRHSNGNKVSIRLDENTDGMVLRVEDNGQLEKFSMGNGIKGIHERAAEMQGRLDVFFDKGFVLQVSVL